MKFSIFFSRFSLFCMLLTVPCWFQSLEFDLVSFSFIHGLRRWCLIFACCWSITISSTLHSIFFHYFLFKYADCCFFKLTVKNCIVYTLANFYRWVLRFFFFAVCSLEACCRQLDLLFVWMASIVTNIQIFFIDFSIWLATLLIECCLNCVNGLLCFFTKSVNEMQEKWIFNET